MQTQEVLNVLRGAVRELSSQPGTPTPSAAGTAAAAGGGLDTAAPPPSASHLLLQISALHKAFLSLSEAFMEETNQRQAEQEEQRGVLQSVRRECSGKLQAVAGLQEDVQQLAAAHGQQVQGQAVLAQRCAQLELEVASLRQELEERRAEEAELIQRQVDCQLATAQQRWQEQHLPVLMAAAAEQAVRAWAAEGLPPLLQHEAAAAAGAAVGQRVGAVQGAVEAAAELAASAAADMAALAGDVRRLSDWCTRIDAAHHNHEQRLGRMEDGSLTLAAAPAAPAPAAAPGLPATPPAASGTGAAPGGAAAAVGQLQEQVRALQAGQARLEERLHRLEQQAVAVAAAAAAPAAAARAGSCPTNGMRHAAMQQQQQQHQLPDALSELDGLVLAAAELPELQAQLAAVMEQQAQQARTTEELVHSVLTDVMALARHTKALNKEMRSLRREAQQTQQALLQSCSTFSRALSIPSPIGPFTSLPPQI